MVPLDIQMQMGTQSTAYLSNPARENHLGLCAPCLRYSRLITQWKLQSGIHMSEPRVSKAYTDSIQVPSNMS